MSNIFLDYVQLSTQYQSTYGNDTVLLYMVGSFYEIYSLLHSQSQEVSSITPIVHVAEICNLNIANKQSQIGKNGDLSQPIPKVGSNINLWQDTCPTSSIVMAGFRDYSLDKYIEKLVDAKYTVVVYDQEKIKEDGKPETIRRILANVYSPGTFLSSSSSSLTLTNNIMCIWIEQFHKTKTFVCGVANVNILTAETHMFEYTSSPNATIHQHTSFDELERIITTYHPSEVVFISNIQPDSSIEKIKQFISLPEMTKIHVLDLNDKTHIKLHNCTKQIYISTILSQIFPSLYDPQFDTYPTATQAFCYLVDFVQEHNRDLMKRIQVPHFTNQSTRLMLANQTLRQLNIVSTGTGSGHLSSVESFLNKCVTPMGKRLFRYQLFHPTFDERHLNEDYTAIDTLRKNNDTEQLKLARTHLVPIRDIDKILRQLVSSKLTTSGLVTLYKSCEAYHHLNRINIMPFLEDMNKKVYIDVPISGTDTPFLKRGVDILLDNLLDEQTMLLQCIEQIGHFFETIIRENSASKVTSSSVKVHETEKSCLSLQVTKKRATVIRSYMASSSLSKTIIISLKNGDEIQIPISDVKVVSVSSSSDEIQFPKLYEITTKLLMLKSNIKNQTQIAYQTLLKSIEIDWYDTLVNVSREIAIYDVLLNKAFISKEYNFCKPQIADEKANTGSHVFAKQLRHPLIEQIQTRESYVPNDICLDQEGMLLTGYNGIGKTSLIRALGISIILAQSGNYVPAQEFVFRPYQSMFCNIEKNDNLFKNMSTFQLEMSELRVILRLSNNNSIILGDELMNSTEIQSGLSIMIALLQELSSKGTSFLIATHFNQLADYTEIHELKNIKLRHMSVSYDQDKQTLVYDRILRDGFGSSSYGLEVARSLCMTSDFIDNAFQIRNKYFPASQGTLSHKTSCYSSKKIKGMCEICNMCMSTEVHHILEQHNANQDGFIGHLHKNHPSNLLALCEKCHALQHTLEIV